MPNLSRALEKSSHGISPVTGSIFNDEKYDSIFTFLAFKILPSSLNIISRSLGLNLIY